jgi:5-methylcytosine-specific restriction endonuclease McrA
MPGRPKRRRGRRWDRTRALAFERDRSTGARCWICGGAIDYSLPISSCGDAWEADHYLPVDEHPELEYDLGNIRPSHARCNRARGKRAGVDLLGTPSRVWRRRG